MDTEFWSKKESLKNAGYEALNYNRSALINKYYLSQSFHSPKSIIMRLKFQSAILFGIAALFFSACSTPEAKPVAVDLDKAKTEIQAMEDAYAAAEKTKDAGAVVAYYSDDATSYIRNEEPAIGKAAIKERMAQRMAKDTTGNVSVYKVVDLFADGNTLVEVGSYSNLNPAGTEVDKGHYMSCFQKRDGKYVCVRDMSTSSKPAKP